jgi:3-dehydroquinate synthase
VDFGHTFSYGLKPFTITPAHGEAVLIDIAISAILARARNLLSKEELKRIFDLIAKLGIVLNDNLVNPDLLWKTLEERTYHRNGLQRVPLPDGLGNCIFVNDIKFEEIQSACKVLENWTEINDTIYQY